MPELICDVIIAVFEAVILVTSMYMIKSTLKTRTRGENVESKAIFT